MCVLILLFGYFRHLRLVIPRRDNASKLTLSMRSTRVSLGACSIADCSSIHGSSTCSLSACQDSSLCKDQECCRDAECLGLNDFAGRSISNDFDAVEQSTEFPNLYGSSDRLACQWLDTGQFCDASPPTWDALGSHIFENHIQPQTQQICHWNECNDIVDYQKLPRHLSHEHELGEYVCLWTGCQAAPFSSSDELDEHIQLMHVKGLDCHWAGCDVVNNDPRDLTNHVFNEHLRPNISIPQPVHDPDLNSRAWLSESSASRSVSQNPVLIPQSSGRSTNSNARASSSPSNVQLGDSNRQKVYVCGWTVQLRGRIDQCRARVHGTENDLQKHVEDMHTAKKTIHGYVCNWKDCSKDGMPFKDRFSLNRHIQRHTGCMWLTNCLCPKLFLTDSYTVYVYVCKFCDKKFAAKDHFENHLRMHEGDKPFQCDQCPSKFSNNESLTIHKRTHSGVKPFKCPECDYCCADSSNMSKHKKIHQRPIHFCTQCGQDFCRPSSLKRHTALHDKLGCSQGVVNQKRRRCESAKPRRAETRRRT